jgi:hypothetical protein
MLAVTQEVAMTTQWKHVGNLMLGVWLALSPWALSYASQSTPAWNAHTVGVVIAALAALVTFQAWEEWVNAALAAWLIVSPYVLGFSGVVSAFWNQLIVGLLVGALAIWAAVTASDGARVKT